MSVRMALAMAVLAVAVTASWKPAWGGESSSRLAPSERPSAQTYVEKAAIADQFEIRASQVALERLQHLDVRQFARTMIDHHSQSTDHLKRSVRQASAPAPVPPPAIEGSLAQKIGELQTAPGNVDQLYLDMQLQAHEDALALHRYYAEHGDDPVLKQAAAERAVLIEHHLAHVQRMTHNLVASAR